MKNEPLELSPGYIINFSDFNHVEFSVHHAGAWNSIARESITLKYTKSALRASLDASPFRQSSLKLSYMIDSITANKAEHNDAWFIKINLIRNNLADSEATFLAEKEDNSFKLIKKLSIVIGRC